MTLPRDEYVRQESFIIIKKRRQRYRRTCIFSVFLVLVYNKHVTICGPGIAEGDAIGINTYIILAYATTLC